MMYYWGNSPNNWKFCNAVGTTPFAVVKSTINGTSIKNDSFNPSYATYDSFSQFKNGVYTNGTHMIPVFAGNQNPEAGYIGFNVSLKDMA